MKNLCQFFFSTFLTISLTALIALSLIGLGSWAVLITNQELTLVQDCKKKNFYYGQKVKSYDSFFNSKELEFIESYNKSVKVRVLNDPQSPHFKLPCNSLEDTKFYQEEII